MEAMTKETAKLFKPIPFSTDDRLHVSLDGDGDHFIYELFGAPLIGSARTTPSDWSIGFTSRLPERKLLKEMSDYRTKFYRVGATDITAQLTHSLFPQGQLSFDDDAKTQHDYLLLSRRMQDVCAQTIAQYKADKTVPPHTWKMNAEYPLKCYQQVALCNVMRSEGYALFMEPGTGKTAVSIAAICNFATQRKEKRPFRALIVCPKNVRSNWQREFIKFSTCKVNTVVLRGLEMKRVEQLIMALKNRECEASVVICSFEIMVRMEEQLKAIGWDMCVMDESHSIKWPETKRTKSALRLRDACARRLILTGTPIANTPLDIWSQLEFVGKGMSGFVSWKEFKSFYGVYEDTEHGSRLVGVQNLPFMQERLARCSFIISKKEALPDLPDKVYDVLECEMTDEQSKAYEALRKTLMWEIESEKGDARKMTVNNVLVKLLRLAQITSGFVKYDAVYGDEGELMASGDIEFFDENPKLETLIEELKARPPRSKTIVWACFKADINAISERFTQEGIQHVTFFGQTTDPDRKLAEEEFNSNPDCAVFLGNPAAGGIGINLLGYIPERADEFDTNCDWEIYYSQGWSGPVRWQSEDRAHRNGTRCNIRISDLCMADTVDEDIRAKVLNKKMTAMSISDLKTLLSNVLKGEVEL